MDLLLSIHNNIKPSFDDRIGKTAKKNQKFCENMIDENKYITLFPNKPDW